MHVGVLTRKRQWCCGGSAVQEAVGDDVLGYIDDMVTGGEQVDELTEADRKVIGSIVGQLNWAARQCRYDLCYVASLVQQLADRGKADALKWLAHGVRRAQDSRGRGFPSA